MILKPMMVDWEWLDQISGPFDDDFVRAVNEPLEQQDRPELDHLFEQ